MESINSLIEKYRGEKTFGQVALELGVSYNFLYRMRQGARNPSVKTLSRWMREKDWRYFFASDILASCCDEPSGPEPSGSAEE